MHQITPIAFWFLRHGETDWNVNGLSQGQVEVPLSESGRAQAAHAGRTLAGRGIRSIAASPLGRARETADIVGALLGLSYAIDADLQETCFGEQEGKPMGPWYDEWVEDRYTPPGAETFADLRARVVPAVNRALALPGPVLIIAHGAMFRAVRAEMGLSPRIRTDNGVPVLCTPGTPWTLETFT
jgi:probable phosphoglycerate mutase